MFFATRSDRQTIVARHAASFVADMKLASATGINADWKSGERYANAIRVRIPCQCPVDLCLIWMHGSGSESLRHVLPMLNVKPCRVIHVLGSASADPYAAAEKTRAWLNTLMNVTYHNVFLGSMPTSFGSRWLTHHEISGGVIKCEAEQCDITVGRIP